MKFKRLFQLSLSLWFYLVAQTGRPDNLSVWYARPATNWLEALPIGNGSLGGMVFGGTTDQRIQFNEQTLWLGSETEMGSYQPCGDVFAEWSQPAAENYRRELNLAEGVCTERYRARGVDYLHEAFCSYPDQVMVIRLTANHPGGYSGLIRLTDRHHARVTAAGKRLCAVGALTNGLAYESELWVLNDGGTVTTAHDGLIVSGANSVTLLLAAGTSFANDPLNQWRGEAPHQRVTARLAAAAQMTYAQLRERQVADYQKLFGSVTLQLGDPPADQPTDVRLANDRTRPADSALAALLFQYGRYLLISSSRPGGLPANLQGIWNQDLHPAWYSGYTTDINIEMNYWPAEPTALAECTEPLFHWLHNIAITSKRTADPNLQAKRGWFNYSTVNPMGGGSGWAVHRPGSAWLSRSLWEHYAYTGDTNFLRSVAYPTMKELVELWQDHLVAGPNGSLITPDGWSPEEGPVNVNGKITIQNGDRTPHPGVSYDQEIVWDLCDNFVAAATVLGVDSELRARTAALRDRLLVPNIGRWGQLQEWLEDVDDPRNQHRHVSHLFGLFPGRQFSPLTTSNYAAAARVTLNARGDGGTGWSKAWKISFWARLQDGERAHKVLRELLTPVSTSIVSKDSVGGGIYPNLFDCCPPFQIDGNFGLTAGMAEMLLQSHQQLEGEPFIQLLPALPKAWPNGRVTGLRARGGFRVDMIWRGGRLVQAKLVAMNGSACRVGYGQEIRTVRLAPGETYLWQ